MNCTYYNMIPLTPGGFVTVLKASGQAKKKIAKNRPPNSFYVAVKSEMNDSNQPNRQLQHRPKYTSSEPSRLEASDAKKMKQRKSAVQQLADRLTGGVCAGQLVSGWPWPPPDTSIHPISRITGTNSAITMEYLWHEQQCSLILQRRAVFSLCSADLFG